MARNEHAHPRTTHGRYHRAFSERARGKFKRADACASHAYTYGGEKRILRTCAHFLAHASVHKCARVCESLFPSVSEDRRPWPRDHERRLIRYISARALRYFILPLYIRVRGLSLSMENVHDEKRSKLVRRKDRSKKVFERTP